MKIALLQCNAVTGDVVGNVARIAAAAQEAAGAGADLCVTPELALTGPDPGSYARMVDFADGCHRGLDLLAEAVRNAPPLLVGAPVRSVYAQELLSNAAVLCRDGQWQVASRKVGANGAGREGRVFELGLSCGILTLGGWRMGIALYGETGGESSFWEIQYASGHNPLMEMVQRGVDAIIHMNATPFCRGSQEFIEQRLSHVAARHHVHLFSVNLAGGFDSGVYSGQSVAFDPTGQLLARGRAFEEEVLIVDTAEGSGKIHASCACPEESVWHALTLGVRDFVGKCRAGKAIVGLSGGMDSALVCVVAAEALGPENVLGVLMPSPYSSEGSVTDSLALAENLGVRTVTLPIDTVMRAFADTLRPGLGLFPEPPHGDTTFENVQARIRGVLLSSLANRARALVLNTGNKSEAAVGYSTLYGDTVGALGVIADLTKTEVYAVAAWFNDRHGRKLIPSAIFEKAPSAELRPGQKDSDSLPPYDVLDPALQRLLRPDPHGAPLNDTEQDIRARMFAAEFKRRQEPPALYLTDMPFGGGWQAPMAGRYRMPR